MSLPTLKLVKSQSSTTTVGTSKVADFPLFY